LDKIYQARLDKILDGPLVGRFSVDKAGRNLIDAGLIERVFDLIEPFITEESDELSGKPSRDKIWFYPFEALRELLVNALAHKLCIAIHKLCYVKKNVMQSKAA
jgi:ATP-dependent DNA helicase RecG